MIINSIIIPHLNNEKRLIKCLDAIYTQIDNETEILLIDNGSDGIENYNLNKYLGLLLFVVPEVKSPYFCRNFGINKAKGENIILCDSNCIPSKGWLEHGLRLLQQDEKQIVSGPIVFEINEHSSVYQVADSLIFTPQKTSFLDGKSYPGGHIFVKKAIFEDIGCFPMIRSGEDVIWSRKATSSGYKLGYNEAISVRYPPKSKDLYRKKAIRMGMGYVEKNSIANHKSKLQLALFGIRLCLPPNPISFLKIMSPWIRKNTTTKQKVKIYLAIYEHKILRSFGLFSNL